MSPGVSMRDPARKTQGEQILAAHYPLHMQVIGGRQAELLLQLFCLYRRPRRDLSDVPANRSPGTRFRWGRLVATAGLSCSEGVRSILSSLMIEDTRGHGNRR